MSDEEGERKVPRYRLEVAQSSRSHCKGPAPCSGSPIQKGILRLGTLVDFGNVRTSFAWRHWGCVTPRIISTMKGGFDSPEELDGFDELPDKDKERVRNAWKAGHVAEEDIPESAKQPLEGVEKNELTDAEEGAEKKSEGKARGKRDSKAKKAPTKKRGKKEEGETEAEEKQEEKEDPKRKRAKRVAEETAEKTKPKRGRKKTKTEEAEVDAGPEPKAKKHVEMEEKEPTEKSKRIKRAPAKRKSTKQIEEEESGEDFEEALNQVSGPEEEEGQDVGKPRSKRGAKPVSTSSKTAKTASRRGRDKKASD